MPTEAMERIGFDVYDGDNHFYQQHDSFTRYLPSKFAEQAIEYVPNGKGGHEVVVGRQLEIHYGDGVFNEQGQVQHPGSLAEYLRAVKKGEGAAAHLWQPVRPEFVEREPRLRFMDDAGVAACLLFPEEALLAEHFMSSPDMIYANYRAFNEWLDDEWGFNRDGRIIAPPYVPLADVDRAVQEVEFVIERGATAVMMRPGPVWGRSPVDPRFDPVWARLNEAGMLIAYHVGETGYNAHYSVFWGEEPNPPAFEQSPWQAVNTYIDRPMMETITALVMGNLFGRFPNLRVISVEHGADWFPYLMRRMDKMRGMARNGPWIGGQLSERPSAVMRQHVRVCPFPEDDIARIVSEVGVECIVMGSDWPHGEGTVTPASFVDSLAGMDDAHIRAVMHDNGRALFGAPTPRPT